MFLFDPLREHRWHSLTVGGAMGLAIAGLAPKLPGSSAGLAGQLRRAGAGEPAGFFLHALIARSWLLLFAVQAMVVLTGRPAMHRRLEVAATRVAVVMLVTGCRTMIKDGRAGTTSAGTGTSVGIPSWQRSRRWATWYCSWFCSQVDSGAAGNRRRTSKCWARRRLAALCAPRSYPGWVNPSWAVRVKKREWADWLVG